MHNYIVSACMDAIAAGSEGEDGKLDAVQLSRTLVCL